MVQDYYINVNEGVDQSTLYSYVNIVLDEHLTLDGFFSARCTDSQVTALQSHSDVSSVDLISRIKEHEVEDSTTQIVYGGRSSYPSELASANSLATGNWGLIRHSQNVNAYVYSDTDITAAYGYNFDGDGVDMVFISEAMINIDSGEYKNGDVSRIQQFQWNTLNGLSSVETINYSSNHRSLHAAGVLAIACSNTYGWAKKSRIYLIPRSQISNPVNYFECARQFHLQKGNSRPTVVFGSFGYAFNSHDPIKSSITFRGTTYTEYRGLSLKKQPYEYGGFDLGIPSEFKFGLGGTNGFSAISTAAQALSDAGVITVYSAGNESQKCDQPGGIDYNNKFVNQSYNGGTVTYYPNRGSAQWASDSIIVGNLSSRQGTFGSDSGVAKEELHFSSNRGDRVDTIAAGSIIKIGTTIFTQDTVVSGTSYSCPQIAGIAAMVLEKYPTATPYQMRRYFRETLRSSAILYTGKTTVTTDLENYGDPTYFNDGCALQGFTGKIAFINSISIPDNPTTLFPSSGSYTYTAETTTSQKVTFSVDQINSKLSSV